MTDQSQRDETPDKMDIDGPHVHGEPVVVYRDRHHWIGIWPAPEHPEDGQRIEVRLADDAPRLGHDWEVWIDNVEYAPVRREGE